MNISGAETTTAFQIFVLTSSRFLSAEWPKSKVTSRPSMCGVLRVADHVPQPATSDG